MQAIGNPVDPTATDALERRRAHPGAGVFMTGARRTWLATIFLAVISLGAGSGCGRSAPATPKHAKPARIVSLTLGTDELLAELVPIERVVAVTVFADDAGISNVSGRYAKEIVRVNDANPERIIALTPDLVCVAHYNSADSLKLLERSGLSIYRNDFVNSMAEIEAGLVRLGERVGEPARAHALVERMRERRRRLAERLGAVVHRPRVLFWSAGYTSGLRSTIDEVIREAGGVNVAADLNLEGSAELAPERVVAADPDVVLLSYWKEDERQGQIASHPILRQLRAVREGHVIAIESRYLTSVSPYVVEATERLARALHPDRFPGAAEVAP
ncbi:iron complex transport system substrate-binding protein [Singulisphaera sp. GP187]|uniref:ABC transporter substrate-binding protein n=1 Tax=Singulisphaera sp. GP187 TaxID=1882752 RepID=UPI000926116B|nr:ABC transporter substrate-binding protein [Singulisphaera sp. GP187]SIO04444.1 iron complex transport system substrate-binding protein [Singulisphaera sp. GP187]